MKAPSIVALLATAALLAAVTARAEIGEAAVTGGRVSGVTAKPVTSFKGIPFAAPPVGRLRWAPPAPPAHWTGVLHAVDFGPSCIQNVVQERKPWTFEFMTHGAISEDCLSLNVWTAAKSAGEKRPVFMWIYGGGFTEGSGAVPAYDGAGPATRKKPLPDNGATTAWRARLVPEPAGCQRGSISECFWKSW